MPPDSLTWYVALVRAGHEQAAQEHLIEAGFSETFCPRRRSLRKARGKATEFLVAVTSGYVLVRTDLFTPSLWHLSCPTEGLLHHGLVRGFIGGWPADPVPHSSIESQREFCDAQGVWLESAEPPVQLHSPGTLVRVLDDLYTNHVFSVVWDDGKGVNLRSLHGVGYSVYMRDRCKVQQTSVPPTPKFGWEAVPNGMKPRRKRRSSRRVAA
jgi:hypothetical protein